jgi:hypothetical protein
VGFDYPTLRRTRRMGHPPFVAGIESESTPLSFVISTGAQRSGEISVWMLFPGNVFLAIGRILLAVRDCGRSDVAQPGAWLMCAPRFHPPHPHGRAGR